MKIKIHCEKCRGYYEVEGSALSMRFTLAVIERAVCPHCLNARNGKTYMRLIKRDPNNNYCRGCGDFISSKKKKSHNNPKFCHSCYMIQYRKKLKKSREESI